MRYTKLIIFAVIALVLIALAVYTSFVRMPKCQTFECYEENMRQCKQVQYLNDGEEATWRYKILGIQDGACVVEVTLLQPKAGELGIEKLSGYSMECGFPKGIVAYPEKDLGSCHGRLKEEMQEIIIKKLHTYIVKNIGEIDDTLQLLVDGKS
ncbi:hypothetical protein J4233_03045 [Candidatus Pacearchaeota archaeon]|nr:hypothetical protein [Candidatus Pacearchaeota archaeon]